MQSQLVRIVDANVNRVAEGLRVLEDISRFTLNDKISSLLLKDMRHGLIKGAINHSTELLDQRNVAEDFGSRTYERLLRPDLLSIVYANSRRVQEGLRVLEEMSQLPDMKSIIKSNECKKKRFSVYQIERNLVSRVLRQDKIRLVKGLYVILDTKFISTVKIIDVSLQTIKGGARIIQLRDKMTQKKDLLALAKDLRQICSSHNIMFIINDYLDVALACDADGIHLGQDDFPLKEARRFLPIDKVIGYSVSNIAQARKAQTDGADYIAVGAIYPTTTKGDAKVVGLDVLSKIRRTVDLPIVAIGGINKNNLTRVFSSGADAVAVISSILMHDKIEKYTSELVFKISGILEKQRSYTNISQYK